MSNQSQSWQELISWPRHDLIQVKMDIAACRMRGGISCVYAFQAVRIEMERQLGYFILFSDRNFSWTGCLIDIKCYDTDAWQT